MSENEKNDKEEKNLPRKLVYKRRSPAQTEEKEEKQQKGLTPEDLGFFRELAPKLSPKARQIINLILTIFDQDGNINFSQLLQIVSLYAGGNKSAPSSSIMELLPLLSSMAGSKNQGQGGSINPAALVGLFNLLTAKARD